MVRRALNHMAAPRLGWAEFLHLARDLDCVGVEFRNDLPGALFEGASPEEVGSAAASAGLRILALAEVKAFDDWSEAKREEAAALMAIARACGAERVSLIARNDGVNTGAAERRAALAAALRDLGPLLAAHDLVGLIEPLGFATCALRFKSEVVEAIHASGSPGRFQIVHDTFHHALAGGGPLYPDECGIIHVSGVTVRDRGPAAFTDPDRELVDGHDRLGNVAQVAEMLERGYTGAVSFEPFAARVHDLADPRRPLEASFRHIEAGIAAGAKRRG